MVARGLPEAVECGSELFEWWRGFWRKARRSDALTLRPERVVGVRPCVSSALRMLGLVVLLGSAVGMCNLG